MKLDKEVGLCPGYIVLDGLPALSPKGQPQFSAHVCCGQTAEWMKMLLGREVGLSPGDVLLHGDPAPPKGAQTAQLNSTQRASMDAGVKHLSVHI